MTEETKIHLMISGTTEKEGAELYNRIMRLIDDELNRHEYNGRKCVWRTVRNISSSNPKADQLFQTGCDDFYGRKSSSLFSFCPNCGGKIVEGE